MKLFFPHQYNQDTGTCFPNYNDKQVSVVEITLKIRFRFHDCVFLINEIVQRSLGFESTSN